VLEAYYAGDIGALQEWCTELRYTVYKQEMEQREQLGHVYEFKILDVESTELFQVAAAFPFSLPASPRRTSLLAPASLRGCACLASSSSCNLPLFFRRVRTAPAHRAPSPSTSVQDFQMLIIILTTAYWSVGFAWTTCFQTER
jgi:hypothetical protein